MTVGSPTPGEGSSAPLRLLVVDDDAGIRTLLEVSVSLDPRFTLLAAAASGEEALAVVRDCRGDECPDIILLDVTLPGRDGIELTRELRELGTSARIALFTGWSDPDTLERATAAGADAVFPKDGEPRKLLDGLAAL